MVLSQNSSGEKVRFAQGLLKIKLMTWLELSQSLGEVLYHTEPLRKTQSLDVSALSLRTFWRAEWYLTAHVLQLVKARRLGVATPSPLRQRGQEPTAS